MDNTYYSGSQEKEQNGVVCVIDPLPQMRTNDEKMLSKKRSPCKRKEKKETDTHTYVHTNARLRIDFEFIVTVRRD